MAPPLAWATCILLVPSAGLAGASVAQLAWGHDGRTREAAAPDGHGAAELIWEASAAEGAAAPQGCHPGERHPWAGAEPGAGGLATGSQMPSRLHDLPQPSPAIGRCRCRPTKEARHLPNRWTTGCRDSIEVKPDVVAIQRSLEGVRSPLFTGGIAP
jgi:hypothetical protein